MEKNTHTTEKKKSATKQQLPKRFSIEEALLDQALSLIVQLPVRSAHKLAKSINDNKVADKVNVPVESSEEAPEGARVILPTDMLNDMIGFLTTYPVFVSMELITMINMGLKVPENKVEKKEPKTVELKQTKEDK